MTNHNDEVAAVAATPTTQDALDVLIERLNYWRSKAIAEAGEIEAMEQAHTELQQRLSYTQKSRDMFMGSAKAWRVTAERNASACAHWQSVALERKGERDELRLDLAGATESVDRLGSDVIELDTQYNRAMLDLARCQETARRITELKAERSELRSATWGMAGRVAELERENGELQQRLIEYERRLCVLCGLREGDECNVKECCTFDATPIDAINQLKRDYRERSQQMTVDVTELRARCIAIANERDAALQQIETLRNAHAQELAAKQHALQVLQSALRSAEAERETLQQAIETMKQAATPLAPQALIDAEDLKLLIALRDAISNVVQRAEDVGNE